MKSFSQYAGDYFYFHISPDEKKVSSYNVSLLDFFSSTKNPPQNIIPINQGYYGASFNYNMRMGILTTEETIKLCENENDDIEFSWVDCKDISAVEERDMKEETAQLVYSAKMNEPYDSPFFEVFQNEYLYLSPAFADFTKIYMKNLNAYKKVLEKKLIDIVNKKTRKYPTKKIPDEILNYLYTHASDGLLIDTARTWYYRGEHSINIQKMFKMDFTELQESYPNRLHRYNGINDIYLIYKKGKWYIDREFK